MGVMAYNGGVSYANKMTAEGKVSKYAQSVLEIKERIKMKTNRITKETRFESYITTPTDRRKKLILSVMTQPMTARQIAYKLGFSDLNAVKPRLTELVKAGKVEVIDKAYDNATKRRVAVYRRIG